MSILVPDPHFELYRFIAASTFKTGCGKMTGRTNNGYLVDSGGASCFTLYGIAAAGREWVAL
jgi:hypothetical protein